MSVVIPPKRSLLDRAAAMSWRFLLVIAALVVLGLIASRLRFVLVPVFVAILLAVVLTPAVRYIGRRVPHILATALVFFALVLAVVGFVALFAPGFVEEFSHLDEALSEGLTSVRDWLVDDLGLSPSRVDEIFDLVRGIAGQNELGSSLLTSASIALQVFAGALLSLVLAFFFVKDGKRLWGWMMSMIPAARRDDVDAAGTRAWRVLGGFLLGSAAQGAIEATIIGLGLIVIGVPLVAPLMLLTFLAAFFPIVGAVTAGVIAILVALVSGGFVDALLVLIVVIIVQQVESNLLAPLVLGRAVRLHPVVVLLALTTGGVLGGVIGAFIAVPLTAVGWSVVKELVQRDVIEPPGEVEPLLDEPEERHGESEAAGEGSRGREDDAREAGHEKSGVEEDRPSAA